MHFNVGVGIYVIEYYASRATCESDRIPYVMFILRANRRRKYSSKDITTHVDRVNKQFFEFRNIIFNVKENFKIALSRNF